MTTRMPESKLAEIAERDIALPVVELTKLRNDVRADSDMLSVSLATAFDMGVKAGRTDVPSLLEHVRAQERELERLREKAITGWSSVKSLAVAGLHHASERAADAALTWLETMREQDTGGSDGK